VATRVASFQNLKRGTGILRWKARATIKVQLDMGMLEGKSIVIIGGTAGLGVSAAEACAREGARLVLLGRDDAAADQTRQKLPNAHVMVGDARDPATTIHAIGRAVQRFGRLDGLYHVAGGSGRSAGDGPLHEITDDGWHVTLELNLTTMFNSNRAAVRQFLKQQSGGAVFECGLGAGLFAIATLLSPPTPTPPPRRQSSAFPDRVLRITRNKASASM